MNEKELKKLIKKNKELLIEKNELYVERYEKNIEVQQIEKQIVEISNKLYNYKNLKKQKIKEFISNMMQYLMLLSIISLGLNIELLNISSSVLNTIYPIFGSIFCGLGVILTIAYNDELNTYKKQIGKEIFKDDYLNNLEQLKTLKENELSNINKRININTKKLDNIYDITLNENIVTPCNNKYEENIEKPKQKSLKKNNNML